MDRVESEMGCPVVRIVNNLVVMINTHMSENNNIISLSEVLESKIVKEKELEYYYDQVKELQRKIGLLETDLKLTKTIINMIEADTVMKIDVSVPILNFDKD